MVSDVMMGGPQQEPDTAGYLATDESPPPEHVKEFIAWWEERIRGALSYHRKAFDRMKEDIRFARGEQWGPSQDDDSRYMVNMVQSELAASVSTLYAKNPTFIVKRKPRMDFVLWDETQESKQAAEQAIMLAAQQGFPPPPDAAALMQDINQALIRRSALDRIAKTLRFVINQQIMQQHPSFKREMKQLVRRVDTTGAGFVKLDFQRLGEVRPEAQTQLADLANRIKHIEQLREAVESEEYANKDKEIEELRIAMKSLQDQNTMITKEGLLFHFPRTMSLIIDPACSQLEGFVGARWIAEEFNLSRCKIKEIYGVDVGDKGKAYQKAPDKSKEFWDIRAKDDKSKRSYEDLYRVWEVYHAETGTVFTICEGFDNYLSAPAAPKLTLERFFPYYALTFNDLEDDKCIYPPSTVRLLRHPQKELNRIKEALRQHRIANKPHYVSPDGALTDTDMNSMAAAPAHAIIQTRGLAPNEKIENLIQQVKKIGIDPNLYETQQIFDDMRRVTRRPEAGFGGGGNSTATADSLAADSRQTEDRSKSDDIDDMLTLLAVDAGITLILQMSADTVKRIAGPGAMWPTSNPEDYIEDILLEIEAGSSGKPNRAMEAAMFQRLFPILVQTPGIQPGWLAKTAIKLADANIDLSEAYTEGMPSIQALNAMAQGAARLAQTSTGNPETDPRAQGPEGSNPTARPDPDNMMTPDQGRLAIPELATDNSILM